MKTLRWLLIILAGILITSPLLSQSISDLMKGYSAYNRFWGNILVVQHGTVVFQESYGLSEKDHNLKNDQNALFSLASVTKSLTAAAIFKLHDEGKLNVYDRVEKYIPGFASGNTDSITIINLLNHTSGLTVNLSQSDDFGKTIEAAHGGNIITIDDLIMANLHSGVKSKPGERYDYNNFGYIMLAYIIEKVSGMDYMSYLKRSIFAEAGMNETTTKADLSGQLAHGYFGLGTGTVYPSSDETEPIYVRGATGLYSSTWDLYKFITSLFSCKLFSSETLHQMLDTCINTNKGNILWTAGLEKEEIAGHTFFSHRGSAQGYSTVVGYMPDDDISIVILSNLVRDYTKGGLNSAHFSFVDEIAGKILEILHGETVPCLPVPDGKADKNLAGKYRLDDTHYLNISLKGDSLILKAEGSNNNFTLFDYNLNREVKDSSANYRVCKTFASLVAENKLDGFEQYANEAMKKDFTDNKVFAIIHTFWEKIESQTGKYISSNVYEKKSFDDWSEYLLSFHFEGSEVIMQLSFNTEGLINGFFILKFLPKCKVFEVNLIPAGKDTYFVNGYSSGGYNDYTARYDRINKSLTFASKDDTFTALKDE
jgi:CubicO group peptidase (beta-lactamase class C family)